MFTNEQDAFILMGHFRSGTRNADGTWTYSLQSCIEQYVERFPNENISYETFRLVERLENKHCIGKGKSTGSPTVLSVDIVNDIQHRMEQSPTKSQPKLSAQAGICYGSCRKASKGILHMHPYKVSVVQQLYSRDHQGRIQFCLLGTENLNDNDVLDKTFMSDDTHDILVWTIYTTVQ